MENFHEYTVDKGYGGGACFKPFPMSIPNRQREITRKVNDMTIGIGMLAPFGTATVLAADTRVGRGDGLQTRGQKIDSVVGKSGSYVIAHAANDANATLSLVRRIFSALEKSDFQSFDEVERVVEQRMTHWARAFAYQLPESELLFGASLKSMTGKEGAVRLYFCQPPNTILPVDNHDPYKAIGSGSRTIDPLWNMLFQTSIMSVPMALSWIAYLMYRAKKDDTDCGGWTNAIVLRDGAEPQWITPTDMEQAEKFSQGLEFLLRGTCSAIIGQTDESAKDFCSKFGDMIFSVGTRLRNFKFHTLSGIEVI